MRPTSPDRTLPRTPTRPRAATLLSCVAVLAIAVVAPLAPRCVLAKDKKAEAAKTGTFRLPGPPDQGIQMAVPADYDPDRWYPLLFVLCPDSVSPDPFVAVWSEGLLAKGWIVAGPHLSVYDNETSLQPLKDALTKVKSLYRIDDRRIVLAGHNAGAMMAWRFAVTNPDPWAAILAFSGEVPDEDVGGLRKLAGRRVFLFRGKNDVKSYVESKFTRDKRYLEGAKATVEVATLDNWEVEFPRPLLSKMSAWIDATWPVGGYREKADALAAAIAAKDVAEGRKAQLELLADLKKSPYPAFQPRVRDLEDALVALARDAIEQANALKATDPPEGLARLETLAKAYRGWKPLEAEASSALGAFRRDPEVKEAVRKKEAETAAASYIEKAEAAEAKGEYPKALDWYRKVSALGETSKKAVADERIKQIESELGGAK